MGEDWAPGQKCISIQMMISKSEADTHTEEWGTSTVCVRSRVSWRGLQSRGEETVAEETVSHYSSFRALHGTHTRTHTHAHFSRRENGQGGDPLQSVEGAQR
jgi:hypothetical protein